jgi:hypothetical protein
MRSEPEHHLPEQVPSALRRFDDPWGVTWRVANLFRRVDSRWLARFAASIVNGAHHERPIFIVGMPRSGTTFLAHLLGASSQLASMPYEGHDIWRLFHHPRYSGWRSDAVGPGEIRPGERRVVNAIFSATMGSVRFIEKTADNCVRLPYLYELFPDATFIVVHRNPCDVINSYINGWRHPTGRFRTYYVPEKLNIAGYTHPHRWCLTLIDDWRSYKNSTVPEIAFAQWRQYVNSVVFARTYIPAAQRIEVFFEDLLAHPDATAADLFQRLDVPVEPRLKSKLAELLANPINALTPPGNDKWRQQNSQEIRELLPRIAPLAERCGYQVDVSSGNCEQLPELL